MIQMVIERLQHPRAGIMMSMCLMILLGPACQQKHPSLWQEGVISVMADDSDWEAIQGALRYTYEKVVRTPQPEKEYRLVHVPDSLINLYTRAHFLIVASTLKSKGTVGRMVQDIIADPGIRQSIESGENFVFVRHDQWAKDQLMLILIGRDAPSLRDRIESNSIMLYELVDREMRRYLVDEVLEGRENRKLSDHLMERYSWTMSMQKDYFMAQEFPEANFLWMQRKTPDRWIFARWVDGGDTSLLHQEWIVAERNRIGRTYYQNFSEQVAGRYLYSKRTTFLERPAVITTGLWERTDDAAGGPFINYTFYDEPTERVYMIDIALFAPGREKEPYLRRMEVIAGTFRTRFDD